MTPTKTNRRLLFSVTIDDCDIQTFTVSGHGGSGKDTSNTGVRIIHRASGARGEGREHREQSRNKRLAFVRMAQTKQFRDWHRLAVARALGASSIEDQVEKSMDPVNLKIEVRGPDGKWTEAGPDHGQEI